jgi:NAD(P)-dependent dehydrogenase (short-subunit alcohol dehydrogenase family)
MFTSRHVTPDGFEQTFALNHLSPFLLTNLLLERLTAARGRVVITASDAHKSGVLDLDDLQSEHVRFRPGRVYGTTKLCNVLFTRELQRRHPVLAANSFHPGVIRTGFGKNDGALVRIAMTLAGTFMRSPEHGARSLVWLALDPAAGDLHGQYLENGRPARPSAQARDDRLAAELWERDKVFADVDYRDWRPRTGVSATGPVRVDVPSPETSGSGMTGSGAAPDPMPEWMPSGS